MAFFRSLDARIEHWHYNWEVLAWTCITTSFSFDALTAHTAPIYADVHYKSFISHMSVCHSHFVLCIMIISHLSKGVEVPRSRRTGG